MWLYNPPADSVASVNKQIAVFPNPAGNTVYIVTSLNINETGVLDIYNVDGIKLKEIQISGGMVTTILSTDALSDGVYIYYLNTNQQYQSRGKMAIAR